MNTFVLLEATPNWLGAIDPMSIAIGAVPALIIGFIFATLVIKNMGTSALARGKAEAEQAVAKAKAEAAEIVKKAEVDGKAEYLKIKESADKEVESTRKEMREHDQRLQKREDVLDRKLDTLTMKEKNLENIERSLTDKKRADTALLHPVDVGPGMNAALGNHTPPARNQRPQPLAHAQVR